MRKTLTLVLTCAALLACGTQSAPPDGDPGGGALQTSSGGSLATAGSGHGGDGGGAEAGHGGVGTTAGGYGGYPDTGPVTCDGPGARFATGVVEVAYGPGQDHGRDAMPDIVLGPPHGGGASQGSLDVVSLGNGGVIAVAFEGNGIIDGPGADFVVFENAFQTGSSIFAELATVEVSSDGITWHAFPCTATGAPYGLCAGHNPVFLDGETGPFDPAESGGDAFDLADVGVSEARYVRIIDREDLQGFTGVFDLDAVGIVHAACP